MGNHKTKKVDYSKKIEQYKKLLHTNREQILMNFGMVFVSVMVGIVMEMSIFGASKYMNPYRVLAIAVAVFLVLFAVVFKKFIWENMHVFFFMISMLLGITFIVSVPIISISWDEQLHYTKTVHMSYGAGGEIAESDYLINSQYPQLNYEDVFKKNQRLAWKEYINEVDQGDKTIYFSEGIVVSCVAYIPAAITHGISRMIGVDFTTRYLLGKLTNLLCYSLIMAAAIRLLKERGKMLVAMIGLIPTVILMASSYGYDWWVISLIVLGYAIFIGELQGKGKISTKKMLLSIAVMGLGMLAKAVYFPLMLPMMLLKKERYEDAKKARGIVVLGIGILVASFIVPLMINAASGVAGAGGDIRGGEDVNAAGQIAYILANFGTYLSILFEFMREYLNPDSAVQYLTMMSYRGRGDYFTVCLIVMAIAAVIDNTEKVVFRKKEPVALAGGYLGVLGALVLVVTALYISFTAVGANTIEGCQPRYILPVLMPFLFFVGENEMKISKEIKRKYFIWGAVGMALIFLLACYETFIIRY